MRRLLGRGSLAVRLAAVVGRVEAGPFEDDRRAGPDQAPELVPAALGALPLYGRGDRLEQLEAVIARVAEIIVGRHGVGFLHVKTLTV